MLHPRARLRGLLEELQGELGRQTVERALLSGCQRARRPRGHAAALDRGAHSRDSGGDHAEADGHGVQSQHLLPQVVQPGVNGGVGPGERACGLVWGPCSRRAPREGMPSTHPSSCWSSPRHTGSRAAPPSCRSRRYSFLATKLNLRASERLGLWQTVLPGHEQHRWPPPPPPLGASYRTEPMNEGHPATVFCPLLQRKHGLPPTASRLGGAGTLRAPRSLRRTIGVSVSRDSMPQVA